LAEGLAPSDLSSRPTLEAVVEVDTAVGSLTVSLGDQVIGQVLREGRLWEPRLTRYFWGTLRPGQTFVDVGAHVGYFSVLASKQVGTAGTVIAVEPEARNLDLLCRNLARNGCANALVVPFAAHSAEGAMSLALDEDNRGAHRLVALGETATTVRCVRLDDVLPEDVDVIKIDVQGYDHDVIAGLERTLAGNPQATVIAELSLGELERRDLRPEVVLAGYEELGFTLSVFDDFGRVRRVTVAEVLARPRTLDFLVILERPPEPPFSARDPRTRPEIAAGLEVNEVRDGLIVSEPARGRVHQLNETAAVVFDLCTGERTVAEIAALVQEVYELADQPMDDVWACLDRLGDEGLVT
jgi:FkbM family methyltransferase